MNEKEDHELRAMRRWGKWIVAVSLLLPAYMVLSYWFHLPDPSPSLDSWEIPRTPRSLWTALVAQLTSPLQHVFFTAPLLVGLWQLVGRPSLLSSLLRRLVCIWLVLLSCFFLIVTYLVDI